MTSVVWATFEVLVTSGEIAEGMALCIEAVDYHPVLVVIVAAVRWLGQFSDWC